MTYKKQPGYSQQAAMGAGMAGKLYPLLDATRNLVTLHTMGNPVECTSGMRVYRPPHCGTFNAEATAIHFLRPAVATAAATSVYQFCIDRQGDTMGMGCRGNVAYGPIPVHPDVEYVSFFSYVGTEEIYGAWVVPGVHDSLNF